MSRSSPAHRVIALWSHPRALSTAFFRMIVERGDFVALHEPFANLAAVGRYDEAGIPATSRAELAAAILTRADQQAIFFKDTTEYRHNAVLDEPGMVEHVTHTFIVRDPVRAIPSHYAINPGVTLDEIGYELQYELFTAVERRTGETPTVLDASDLVKAPGKIVQAYCNRIGIPFVPAALCWTPGQRPEWARTASWHQDVDSSSGFSESDKQYPVRVDNDARLAEFCKYHMPFYEELRDCARKQLAEMAVVVS